MNESQFSREVRKSLEKAHGDKCAVQKIVSSGMMGENFLDLLGGINGKHVSIESKFIKKLPVHAQTKLGVTFSINQIATAKKIALSNGSACGIVCVYERKIAYIVPPSEMEAFNSYTLADLNRVTECGRDKNGDWVITREPGQMWDVTNLSAYLLGE